MKRLGPSFKLKEGPGSVVRDVNSDIVTHWEDC